jgi:uncharacterized membrane protein
MEIARPSTRTWLVSERVWPAAVWIGAGLYAALLTAESIADHNAFRTGLDTAISDQLLWLLAHREEPFLETIMLAGHFQPGIVLLIPLYWLGLGIPGLFAAQAIAMAATGPALFALARNGGATPAVAAIPALLWLTCPWVASVNLFEFRPDLFAPVLVVLSVLFGRQGRNVLLAATVILALSLKEDIALTYVILGVLLATHGRRRAGTCVAAGSAVWAAGAFLAIELMGSSAYEAFAQRWAGDRGETVPEALVWSLERPFETLSDFASQSALGLVALLLSTGGLALLGRWWLLLALPTAVYNALSAYAPQHDLVHHYHLGTLTGLFVAAAMGAPRLATLGHRARLAATAGVVLALAITIVGGVRAHGVHGDAVELDAEPTRRALEHVPSGVAVAATRTLLPHLSQRAEIWSLPEPFIRTGWGTSLAPDELERRAAQLRFVAYARGDQVGTFYTGEVGKDRAVPDVRRRLATEGFVVIARAGPVEILERR